MSYHYKVVDWTQHENVSSLEDHLNELGEKGWKVVASGGAGGSSSGGWFKEGWIILMKE